MKRGNILLGSVLLSISGVLANPLTYNLARGSAGVSEIFGALFGPFFMGLLNAPRELLFENILLFFIIFASVLMSVRKITVLNDNKAIVAIVTVSVSLLAARFISIEYIYAVLIPYQVLGIVMTAFLPILLGFFFIHGVNSPVLRKMFWIFFIVVFFAMWTSKYYEAGAPGWIYFWSAVASLIFFIFDGTIHRYFIRIKLQEQGLNSNLDFSRKIRKDLRELHESREHEEISEEDYKRTRKRLTKQLHDLARF